MPTKPAEAAVRSTDSPQILKDIDSGLIPLLALSVPCVLGAWALLAIGLCALGPWLESVLAAVAAVGMLAWSVWKAKRTRRVQVSLKQLMLFVGLCALFVHGLTTPRVIGWSESNVVLEVVVSDSASGQPIPGSKVTVQTSQNAPPLTEATERLGGAKVLASTLSTDQFNAFHSWESIDVSAWTVQARAKGFEPLHLPLRELVEPESFWRHPKMNREPYRIHVPVQLQPLRSRFDDRRRS